MQIPNTEKLRACVKPEVLWYLIMSYGILTIQLTFLLKNTTTQESVFLSPSSSSNGLSTAPHVLTLDSILVLFAG